MAGSDAANLNAWAKRTNVCASSVFIPAFTKVLTFKVLYSPDAMTFRNLRMLPTLHQSKIVVLPLTPLKPSQSIPFSPVSSPKYTMKGAVLRYRDVYSAAKVRLSLPKYSDAYRCSS